MALGRLRSARYDPGMRPLFLVVILLGVLAAPAVRAAKLSDFYGYWVGTGVAETEVGEDSARQQRDLEVILREHPRGFQLCWATVRRTSGRPARETLSMFLFEPTDEGSWRAFFTGESSAVRHTAWAVIKGDTLTVSSHVVDEAGNSELQVYNRTLRKGAMELLFARFTNDELQRTVQGNLRRRPAQAKN